MQLMNAVTVFHADLARGIRGTVQHDPAQISAHGSLVVARLWPPLGGHGRQAMAPGMPGLPGMESEL